MTYQDKVLDYIAQPENLPVALEVADAVQQLREIIHRRFWPLFAQYVQLRLLNSEFAESWRYIPFPGTRLKKEYEGSYISPIQPKGTGSPFLHVMFGQGGRDGHYHFVTGVTWGRKLPDPNHPTLKDLKKELVSRKLTGAWDWWPGWRNLPYALEGGDFMVKFYHTPNEVVEELAEEYWQLFLDLRPVIEPINKALEGS
jgi:hypothetical protein